MPLQSLAATPSSYYTMAPKLQADMGVARQMPKQQKWCHVTKIRLSIFDKPKISDASEAAVKGKLTRRRGPRGGDIIG